MKNTKRYDVFTLGRLPFWLFVSAGVAGMTLVPLFQNDTTIAAVFLASLTVIFASIAARLRDIGFSAWWAPLGIFPTVALWIGIKAGAASHHSRSASPGSGRRESLLR